MFCFVFGSKTETLRGLTGDGATGTLRGLTGDGATGTFRGLTGDGVTEILRELPGYVATEALRGLAGDGATRWWSVQRVNSRWSDVLRLVPDQPLWSTVTASCVTWHGST